MPTSRWYISYQKNLLWKVSEMMKLLLSNRLAALVAVIVVLMVVFLLIRSCSTGQNQAVLLEAVPLAPMPDADTPIDTIKTLTAKVADMIAEMEALRLSNDHLREERDELQLDRTRIEESIQQKIDQALIQNTGNGRRLDDEEISILYELQSRMDRLDEKWTDAGGSSNYPVDQIDQSIPYAARRRGSSSHQIVWITPLGGQNVSTFPSSSDSYPEDGWSDSTSGSRPVFTIPKNAVLIGAVALTSMIGRVPVQGQVRDPMPFKVLTGAENLSANGLSLPEIYGMIWSGTAVGDWTLSCVSGYLESATFVFADGSIQTVDADTAGGSGNSKALAWISDQYGTPCVPGERKSNAMSLLLGQTGITAAQAGADAAAGMEITNLINSNGGSRQLITGDTAKYVLGKTLAGGTQSVANWIAARAAQNFDAVFVPAGQSLVIHVDREMAVDYQPEGRKLHHE